MIRLPRLPRNWNKVPGLFERYWDEVLTSIENSISSQTTVSTSLSLLTSYVETPTPAISADSSGIITINPHTRVYGSGNQVAVSGGTLNTGSPAGSIVRVFYSDPSFNGGSVTYAFSVDPAPKPSQKDGIHVVGAVFIPVSGTVIGATVDPVGSVSL